MIIATIGPRFSTSGTLRAACALAVALLLWLPHVNAAVVIPPRVFLAGVLLVSNDDGRKGALDNLEVLIGREKRIFLLDKMKITGSVGRNRTTLQRIFPPVLRVEGPDELIGQLVSPEFLGKTVMLEGFLYVESRMLSLVGVQAAKEMGAHERPSINRFPLAERLAFRDGELRLRRSRNAGVRIIGDSPA